VYFGNAYGGWGGGGYSPAYTDWGSNWGDPYPYGGNQAVGNYYYSYVPDDSAANAVMDPGEADLPQPPSPSVPQATATEPLSEARSAFLDGDYRNALRLALHAEVESPQDARPHELAALALFALGDYLGAASRAHVALVLGAPSDWNSLYGYYNDAEKYTGQLRRLEKTVAAAPNSAYGHFLLGYHYLMIGAKDNAKTHFAKAAKLTPDDKLAGHILRQLQAGGDVTPPELPRRPETRTATEL